MAEGLVTLGKRTQPPVRPQPAAGAPRIFIETYGCQMNVADTELIGGVRRLAHPREAPPGFIPR